MWSLSRLTIPTIFMAVFCNELSIAFRTLIRSGIEMTCQSLRSCTSFPTRLTALCLGSGDNDLDQPLLPDDVLIGRSSNVRQPSSCLPSLLVEELYCYLTSSAAIGSIGGCQLMYERGCLSINQCLKFWWLCNVWESNVQMWQVSQGGSNGREVAMEEDSM